MIGELVQFIGSVLRLLPSLLLPYGLAWLASLALLVFFFTHAKRNVRHHVTQFDETLRFWAHGVRYRHRENTDSDRIARTWFFRFWTNFASAPSLCTFSLLVPFGWWYVQQHLPPAEGFLSDGKLMLVPLANVYSRVWLFPALCYAGAMLLSFVIKRVFNRVRPPREGKAFGYKLKDPSFPSGHSLTSLAFWLPLAFVVWRLGAIAPIGIALFALLAAAIVLLTGLSRIYLGVHFPSDVAGGYIIGLVWCGACYIAIYYRL